MCRVSTFFRTCLSCFHFYLFHSNALNKCKIIICLGVDGVQWFGEDDEMIILDYVTNCTTVNPQESQMTSVITSKRTKRKRGLETALGNKIFLTFSTSKTASNQTIKKEFLHFEQAYSATFVRYEGGHLKAHHHYPEASQIRLKKVEQVKKKNREGG